MANNEKTIIEKISSPFNLDQDIEVTPTSFKEYGVFCNCGNGYSGLIHISNITLGYVKNVSEYFTIGQPVKVRIIRIDEEKKQLELSTKVFDKREETELKDEQLKNKVDNLNFSI